MLSVSNKASLSLLDFGYIGTVKAEMKIHRDTVSPEFNAHTQHRRGIDKGPNQNLDIYPHKMSLNANIVRSHWKSIGFHDF